MAKLPPNARSTDPPPSPLEKILSILEGCEEPNIAASRKYYMKDLMSYVPKAREERMKANITTRLGPVIRCYTAPERVLFGSRACWLRSAPCLIYSLTLLFYVPKHGLLVESTSPEFCDNFLAEHPGVLEFCIKVLFWRSHDPEIFVELEDLRQRNLIFPGYVYEQMQDSAVRILGRYVNGSVRQVEDMAISDKSDEDARKTMEQYSFESQERALWIASLPVTRNLEGDMSFAANVLDVMLHCVQNPDLAQCLKGLFVTTQRITVAADSITPLGINAMTKLCELASRVTGQISAKTALDLILAGFSKGIDDDLLCEAVNANILETLLSLIAKFTSNNIEDPRQQRLARKCLRTTGKLIQVLNNGSKLDKTSDALRVHARHARKLADLLVRKGCQENQVTMIIQILKE
jgi:hypothetical protein